MNFLERLLDGAGAKWVPLGEVTEYSPSRVDAAEVNASTFVGVDNLVADKGGRVDATYLPNTARLTSYEIGDVLIGNIRPYLKKIWLATDSGGCSGDVLAIRTRETHKEIVNTRFLYYILSSDQFFAYNMQHAKGAKMPRGDKAAIMGYQIPIPCLDNPERSLAIQTEIVRILDSFTELTVELTTELTTELTARQKQYHHYRDQLLRFEDGVVEWKTLGEIGEVTMCKRILKAQTAPEGDVPFYKIGTFGKEPDAYIPRALFEEYKNKYSYPRRGEILISASGTIGRTVIYDGEDAYFQDSNIIWVRNDESRILNKFLYFFYQIAKWSVAKGGTINRLYLGDVKKMSVPVPSLDEQERIASILDQFDTLTQSLTEGLPREIELRQKQYEYYRDLLFDFPRPGSGEVAVGT